MFPPVGAGGVQASVWGRRQLFTFTPRHVQTWQSEPVSVAALSSRLVRRLSDRHSPCVVCRRTLYVGSDRRLLDTACRDVIDVASRLYFRSTGDVIRHLQGIIKISYTLVSVGLPFRKIVITVTYVGHTEHILRTSTAPYHADKKRTKTCDIDLWSMTLKFNRVLDVVEVHIPGTFHQVQRFISYRVDRENWRRCRKQYCRRLRGQ